MWGLSLVVASGGHSSSWCAGLSLSWPLLLWSTSSRHAGSVVVAHGLSSSAACGIFPDQGSNPCPLHWQADSQPLCQQGSPHHLAFLVYFLGLHYAYLSCHSLLRINGMKKSYHSTCPLLFPLTLKVSYITTAWIEILIRYYIFCFQSKSIF